MSALTSSMAESWSGVSSNGNIASISVCHGVSWSERETGHGAAAGVEVHEVEGELLGGLARLPGGAAPVRGVQGA